MTQFKDYSDGKRKFREGMRALLKRRALGLIKTAFVKGLKLAWRREVIAANLDRAAEYASKARLMKAPFKLLQKRSVNVRKGRKVG